MMRQLGSWVVFMALVIQITGCVPLLVGAAAGAGGVVWVTGKLQQDLSASLDKTHAATLASLRKLRLPVMVNKKDKLTAKVESEYADGKHVWIDLLYVTQSTTKVSIRVGTMGDEARSREILDNIIRGL